MTQEILGVVGGLALIILAALFSYINKHQIHKDLLFGASRNIIQLSLLGYVLTWIFKQASPYLSITTMAIMTLNSAIHARSRVKSKYKGIFLDQLTASAISIWPLAFIGSHLLSPGPWWQPQLFLPIVGMLLGNSLNGISIGVNHFTHSLKEKKDEIQTLIALGASTKEATMKLNEHSIHLAMTPSINAMVTMGIVSIPGMMTGQLLAGNDPLEASLTQMIIMMLIVAGTYSGTYIGMRLARKKLINSEGQLCF